MTDKNVDLKAFGDPLVCQLKSVQDDGAFVFDNVQWIFCQRTCRRCQEKFNDCQSWLNHIEQAHEATGKANFYQCDECHVSFISHGAYRNHTKKHEPKKFKCQTCDRPFGRQSDLNQHLKTAHQEKDLSKFSFQCELCHKSYDKKQKLYEHNSRVHKGLKKKSPQPKSQNQIFSCDKCDKKCLSSAGLKNHQIIHLKI